MGDLWLASGVGRCQQINNNIHPFFPFAEGRNGDDTYHPTNNNNTLVNQKANQHQVTSSRAHQCDMSGGRDGIPSGDVNQRGEGVESQMGLPKDDHMCPDEQLALYVTEAMAAVDEFITIVTVHASRRVSVATSKATENFIWTCFKVLTNIVVEEFA